MTDPKPTKHPKSSPTNRFGDDDQAHFHFDEFAITLARLAASKETRTPLTIGLSGAWGSGKTTLLRRIRVLLDQTQVLLKTGGTRDVLSFANPGREPGSRVPGLQDGLVQRLEVRR